MEQHLIQLLQKVERKIERKTKTKTKSDNDILSFFQLSDQTQCDEPYQTEKISKHTPIVSSQNENTN